MDDGFRDDQSVIAQFRRSTTLPKAALEPPFSTLTCRFVPFSNGPLMFSPHRESGNAEPELHRRGRNAPPERNADVAQLVAHHLAKVRVAGSNPVIRSRGGLDLLWWSGRVVRQRPAKPCTRVRFPSPPRAISSAGERFPDTEEVTGSIPVSRTKFRGSMLLTDLSETTCGCSAAGSASPCQGEGRGFESRHPLQDRPRAGPETPILRSVRSRPARLAQRESASLTRKRSLVQSQYRAPPEKRHLATRCLFSYPGPGCRLSPTRT